MCRSMRFVRMGGAAGGSGPGGAPTNSVGDGKGFATYAVPLFVARRNKPVNEVSTEVFQRFRVGSYNEDEWSDLIDDPTVKEASLADFHSKGEAIIYDPATLAGVILRKKRLQKQAISANSI
ncbi:hypothetical protein [Delftia phage PhiW-14]|uniref:Uncharacterized protein n=1 Tax=Delftia phage PhiW-14 TaxID=665032 RepID=C9DG52_BPW14|nr:hypothetical protein DP-phiW-14_gp081 [Delftia phage PhiW-14]ACV50103.1 hypothetical protein [Delftia phage PhiW-14]